jgi:hypothetical protein
VNGKEIAFVEERNIVRVYNLCSETTEPFYRKVEMGYSMAIWFQLGDDNKWFCGGEAWVI